MFCGRPQGRRQSWFANDVEIYSNNDMCKRYSFQLYFAVARAAHKNILFYARGQYRMPSQSRMAGDAKVDLGAPTKPKIWLD